MKNCPGSIVRVVFPLLLACTCLAATVNAQSSRDKYVISARAGGINYVAGEVLVRRSGGAGQQSLSARDDLRAGDVVTTGADGRVEVLLNPGSYLRVAGNSEFELTETALDNLRVRLSRGGAIVEATGIDDLKLMLELLTPQTRVAIIRHGLYRVSVLAGGATEVSVRKGRALVGNDPALTLKGNRRVRVGGTVGEIAKIDKQSQDSLDAWSKQRAESLAKANQRIESRALMNSLALFDREWSLMSLSSRFSGVWVYDWRLGGYSFSPFNPWGWSSPYGYSYYNGGFPFGGYGGWRSAPAQPRPSGNPSPRPGDGGSGGDSPTPQPLYNPPNPGRRGPREPLEPRPSNYQQTDRFERMQPPAVSGRENREPVRMPAQSSESPAPARRSRGDQ
jgi:hypothetical protein